MSISTPPESEANPSQSPPPPAPLPGIEFHVHTVETLVSNHAPKISSLDGHLREVVAYKNLDHTGPKFCLIIIRW